MRFVDWDISYPINGCTYVCARNIRQTSLTNEISGYIQTLAMMAIVENTIDGFEIDAADVDATDGYQVCQIPADLNSSNVEEHDFGRCACTCIPM